MECTVRPTSDDLGVGVIPEKDKGAILKHPHQPVEKRYFGIDEMATYLGVARKTLYAWVWKKQIPYHKFCRLVKFDIHEINKWIKERRIKPIKIS